MEAEELNYVLKIKLMFISIQIKCESFSLQSEAPPGGEPEPV